ncbi:tRNA (guanine(9)-N(1))-methyltransferase [Polyrhizophydium stewartii]|uniref:tRNA (guanine(9)-N1)-methyltransferase n=1 Tax=Polyrhizophydium stewartii TaxID=2732419 RepID=A0ABR4N3H6_9FUNG
MGTRLSKHDGGPTRAPPRGNDAADGAARPLVRKRAASSSPPPSPRAPSRPRTEASEHSSKSDDNKDHGDGAALRAGAAGPAPAAAAAQAQAAASATADVAAVDGLSKNARKRLQRQQKWEQERDQRRAKHREEKQRLREQRVAQGLPANSRKKKNKIVQEASGVRVAIDCGFEDYMVDSEVRSTVSQLGFSYTSNRLPPKRLDLFVTSFTPRIKALTQQRLPTYAAWRNMSFDDEHYTQIFDKSECVYLTADSPNVITQLDPTKVYIVGGIVDRNRHKRLCLGEAEKHGVAHARLPIDSYVAMSARKVLTINHVVEIVVKQGNPLFCRPKRFKLVVRGQFDAASSIAFMAS